ncbi:phosphate ABC transporter permease [Haloarculaceae archaeon H-GB2-1]|nr:phosphate ABC transporter permease [Haloarculaceae archaeon H-GB1-1]MEA5386892.1 phosphate ABC transporter permease [Haloarculaceae archaeon H-GB11]MEA5408371.1 phosphate ABC transporter permease [Haloarculaceae archaeon H-GB2-1]
MTRGATARADDGGSSSGTVGSEWTPDELANNVRVLAGAFALLAVASVTLVRLAVNAPMGSRLVPPGVPALAMTAAHVVPAVGALAVALTAASTHERIGLLAVGVFPLLSLADGAAAVPAAGALVAGGALVVLPRFEWNNDWHAVRRGLVAAVVLASVGLSLVGAMGVAPAFTRPVGSELFLLALAATVVYARPGVGGWFAGALVALGIVFVGSNAPFVTGAAVLVTSAVVRTSLFVLALGLGGAVAATAGLARDGRVTAALGIATVALAGVPATVPRATAVVLGLVLTVLAVTERQSEETTHG